MYLFHVAQTRNFTLVVDANTKRVLDYFLIFIIVKRILNTQYTIYKEGVDLLKVRKLISFLA